MFVYCLLLKICISDGFLDRWDSKWSLMDWKFRKRSSVYDYYWLFIEDILLKLKVGVFKVI